MADCTQADSSFADLGRTAIRLEGKGLIKIRFYVYLIFLLSVSRKWILPHEMFETLQSAKRKSLVRYQLLLNLLQTYFEIRISHIINKYRFCLC